MIESDDVIAAVHESENGTKRTSGDVRYMVANGVRADMALTSRFGRG
jgi:hypothetical protein